MADGNKKKDTNDQAQGSGPSGKPKWYVRIQNKWVAIFAASTLIIHFGLFLMSPKVRGGSVGVKAQNEIGLGDFTFLSPRGQPGQVTRAEFSLYLSLLSDVDSIARERLAQKKFKVEQEIEELLRQAHAGDFDDPVLAELKRQIQETVNQCLEMRAITEVIITDFSAEGSPGPRNSGQGTDPEAGEPVGTPLSHHRVLAPDSPLGVVRERVRAADGLTLACHGKLPWRGR